MRKEWNLKLLEKPFDEYGLELLFAEIFRSYELPLYTLAFRMTKDRDTSQDIVQEVFVKLWEIRKQVHEIDNIEFFLFRLARNKIIDFMRKVHVDDRLKEHLWHVMKDESAYQSGVEQKEFHAIVAKAVDLLPERRKAIYLLRDEGLNYEQIASEMDISRHTVKHQVSAALQFIRSYLKKRIS